MKSETILLQGLFAACLLTCLLTFGAMLTSHPEAPRVATTHTAPAPVVVAAEG
ncbi:hypothetical protein FHW69_003187 [Luteibacter sp. Sphag1AF]|uniref:hypothetical protein n=1 Tax=Luteibacter sp. Sphag1AF TaxID=2587031 RepID=UPI00160B43EE|nr:hypothetical protein [Luteibacter sp. Sphag1AF]MBB3228545.1 hypothetical protein [Luteibacter sp. Sphag1AF]